MFRVAVSAVVGQQKANRAHAAAATASQAVQMQPIDRIRLPDKGNRRLTALVS